MGDNAPSAEQVANLEREQREAELQAEFAEFERQEKERKQRDKEREKTDIASAKERTATNTVTKESRRLQFRTERDAVRSERVGGEKVNSMFGNLDADSRAEEDKKLQREFDLFEAQEKQRIANERAYDSDRKKKEAAYSSKYGGNKTFTGIRMIDDYLDKADMSAETRASGKRIREESEIRKQEAAGQISPEYASFRRGKISETYEKQKVSDARIVIGGATKYAESAVKGASGYLDNAPSRSTGMGGRKSIGRASAKRKPQEKGFASGVSGFAGAQFPSFSGTPQQGKPGQPQMKSFGTSFPGVGVEMPKRKGISTPRASKPVFPSGLAQGTSMFGSKVTKSEGIKLNIGSPFGAKKTSPLKKGTKKKSLW